MPAEAGIQKSFAIPGFRLALAIARLAGMTFELFNELKKHHASLASFHYGRELIPRPGSNGVANSINGSRSFRWLTVRRR
jgi:hypothetical protein